MNINLPFNEFSFLADIWPWIVMTIFAALFFLMLYLAVAVQADAARRLNVRARVFLIGPWGWFFVVLLSGGFSGALAYWLIHYSSLRYQPAQSND